MYIWLQLTMASTLSVSEESISTKNCFLTLPVYIDPEISEEKSISLM